MSEMVKVVVDAMGGDYAPDEIVKGVERKREHPGHPYRSTECDRSRASEIPGLS